MAEPHELGRIIRSVENWRKLSDRLFQVGPLKVGLDGVLTWIPGVGDAYTIGAGGFLLYNAVRARASGGTITKMALLLGADTLVGSVPILGDAFDFVFRAHARSSRILLRELNARHAELTEAAPGAPAPQPRPAAGPERDDDREQEQEQVRRVEALRAQAREAGPA